jgi:hypothetical protein
LIKRYLNKVCQCFGLLTILFFSLPTLAQNSNRVVQASESSVPITVDGILDEETWINAESSGSFWQNFPYDTTLAETQTFVKIAFDQNYIYVAAECFDDQPDKSYVITSLRRDFSTTSDFFQVVIDPFQDKLNGFVFGVNPLGVQQEGMISFGADIDWGWDNKWLSDVKRYADKWVVEMAIPLKTLRFESGSQEWGANFLRSELKRNELSAWSKVGRVYPLQGLAFEGKITFDKPIQKNGSNISIIPYATGSSNKDYQDENNTEQKLSAGVDAKIAVSSALNLDLTFNPDFSQVEVDRQVTNLSRFEIFFPERRQFFLENSDIFARFGFSSIRPFFSRRIGVGSDPYTGQFSQNPIFYGARLSGRVNDKWRIGLMNMQTAREKAIDLESQNYTVAAVQRQVFSRSSIAAIFVNKQATSDSLDDFSLSANEYNRVVGVDYNLASKDGKWEGKFFYHRSISPGTSNDAYSHASYLNYNSKYFYFEHNHEYVGANYNAETGYVPRRNYWRFEPNFGFWFYPKNNRLINQHGPYGGGDAFWRKTDEKLLDADMDYGWVINFQSSAWLRVFYRFDYTYLFSPFDPTNTDGLELAENTHYIYHSLRVRFQSNARKLFNYFVNYRLGQYFNGNINSLAGTFTYRAQPYGNFGLDYSINLIRLPTPYADADLLLIGPSIDWAFSKKVFIKAVVQYNNQINNINTNVRFQWRFKPVSDFYLVYTDNYTETGKVKNRGIVFKATYWLNL